MAQADFLADGAEIPAGSAFKSLTSQTILPEWYTNYAMDVLSNQQAVSQTPYQTYQAPRVAGFTPTQQQGQQQANTAATAYQPYTAAAGAMLSGASGQPGGLQTAQPYFSTAAGYNPVSTAQPGLDAAKAGLMASGSIDPLAAAQGYFNSALGIDPAAAAASDFGAARSNISQAQGMSGLGTATPYLSEGARLAGSSTTPWAINMASPYLQKAGGTVEDVTSYMNPYEQSVVDYIGQQGARNLRETLLPAIEGRYISAGQFGDVASGKQPSGYMTDTARALRDVSADILGQQAQLRQSGYTSAQAAKAGDLSRQAGIGATAGNLGAGQQAAVLAAGSQMAGIGGQYGGLTAADQAALSGIAGQQAGLGAQEAGFAQGQQQLQQGIGGQVGGLTQAQQAALAGIAGQQAGIAGQEANLAQGQQNFYSGLGATAAGLQTGDTAQQAALAGQTASLGGLAQQYGLTGAGALSTVGQQQQALNQQNLDTAYQDYLRQQGYPQTQIDAMIATMKGIAPGVPSGSQEYGIVPMGVAEQGPGTAASVAAAALAAAGIIDKFA